MTSLLRRLRDLHLRVASGGEGHGERGSMMVELIAAMVIMSICGAIFTGAVVTLNKVSNQAQAVTNASAQNNQAYQALDKIVRYATAISTPGLTPTGNWYVELSDTTSGAEVCTQLRVLTDKGQLQRRTWTAATPANVTLWVPLASGITNGSAPAGDKQPFTLRPVTPTATHQRLGITLVAQSGPASQLVSSTSSFDLTALNGPAVPTSTSICQQVGRQ